MGQVPNLREWIGDRIITGISAFGYTVKNLRFESTIAVPRESIEDDKYGVFSPMLQDMGRDAALHPDQMIFDLLSNGFTSLCYDGQSFFDTDHPVVVGDAAPENTSNMQAGSGEPWFLIDASRAIKPLLFQQRVPYSLISLDGETEERVFMRDEYLYGVRARCNAGYGLWQMAFGSKATLNGDNYALARKAMMQLKGEGGKKLGIMPTHMVVGPSNEADARALLKAATGAAGASNVWLDSVELIVTPQLS
jgi:phage major head subunit gpT-like protein